jgi:hypothetical protein
VVEIKFKSYNFYYVLLKNCGAVEHRSIFTPTAKQRQQLR